MKKIFTLAAAILASLSLTWAAYAPQADEVIILKDVYDASATEAGYSTHAAIAWGGTASTNSKKAGDPNNNGEATSSNVPCYSTKGNGGGKNITVSIEGCSQIIVYHEKHSSRYVELRDGSATGTLIGKGVANTYYTAVDLNANNSYSIFLHGTAGSDDQDFTVYAVKLIKGETCTDPELTVSPTEGTGFVGDPIDIAVTSNNQSKPINADVTVDGVPGVYGTDYTFSVSTGLVQATPLKAGTFVITFSQASNDTYCAAEESATFVISEKTPVASVTIDGPTAGYAGNELTYTATAEGATAYQWLVDGVDANTNAATFTYTAVKGNHSIVCKARNEFNAEDAWIASDAKAVTITKLCGMLIKATHKAAKTADIDPTSVVGGTIDKNTQDGGKLGSNDHYFGIKLSSGSFMPGDVVTCVATALSGGNTATLFSDKGTTSLGSAAFDTESLTATITLTESAEWIYLYRKDGSVCNPTMGSISVTRSCEDSNDANIKSLTINGVEVEENEGVFAYTVSAKENLAQVAVAYTIHPLATATPASGFNVDVPAVGDPANTQVITVTAEDGTQKEYTISVAKAASLNNDATLKALSVEGFELTPAFDPAVVEYAITKAYEAELPATTKVTAETNDANATFNVAYNELVENEILVQVLAEDGETANTYSIKVYSAEAIKSLSRVLFSNGFDAFIDNTNRTVKAFYLQGEEAPTATTITAGANCTAGEIVDGKIVVTGADESLAEYAVTLEAVAANTNVVEETAEAGAFDGTEAWVKAGLYLGNTAGFNAGKYVLRRQLKGSDAADDQRVIAGWVRAYFFVGNASKLELANTANKKVKYAIDGGEYTESEAEQLVIELEAGNHMIEIVTNQSSGDCNLSAPKLVKRTATGIENAEAEMKAVKIIRDGQVLILRDGKFYNALGAEVK